MKNPNKVYGDWKGESRCPSLEAQLDGRERVIPRKRRRQ
jgi:hypothetical protein